MNVVITNPEKFQINLSVHSLNTTQNNHLHIQATYFFSIQKGKDYVFSYKSF
jgi:hypothetical protein